MTKEEAIRHFEMYINNDCYTIEHQQACRMAISALQNQPVWIPVTERLPDAEDVFLCWSKELADMMFCYTSDFKHMEVTHWMPLPEPPKEEE